MIGTAWWHWVAFNAVIIALILLDLLVIQRGDRLSIRRSLLLSAMYVAAAAIFAGGLLVFAGTGAFLAFVTGYVLEKTLSFDNIFLFVLIFRSIGVPPEYQRRVLMWGVLGALVMRGIFIAAGAAFVAHFDWAFYVFGALLLLSGGRLIFLSAKDLEDRRLFRFLRRHLPVTREYRGHRFMMRKDGALRATPLLVALVLVEASDVVMALDSIPAIFAVTREPFLVYSAVVFSILGLRALYFVLQGMVDRFRYLQPAVAVVLILLGIKMITDDVVELPPWIALATTVAVVAGAVGLSLWRKPQRRARAEAA